MSCRQTPLSPYSPYPGGRAHALGEEGQEVASALGMKRLRETPPEERLRNARRAVKRLRHEARYAPCCFSMLLVQGCLPEGGWLNSSPCLLEQTLRPEGFLWPEGSSGQGISHGW